MLTAENIAANRRTLSGLLRSQMSLPDDGTAWTYSQRVEYNKAFAAYVLAHPASFSDADTQTAAAISRQMPTQLDETSIAASLSAFGDEALQNARDINPLDKQNIKQVAMTLLIAAVFLGGVYIVVRNWPKGPHPVPA